MLIFAKGDDYRAFQTVANLSLLVTPPDRPALQDLDGLQDERKLFYGFFNDTLKKNAPELQRQMQVLDVAPRRYLYDMMRSLFV